MRAITSFLALALLPALAWADTAVNETHALAPGGRIELSNIAGKVSVRGWDRKDVALTGTLGQGLTLKQEKSASRVRWEVKYPSGRSSGGATLELRVPHGSEVQLGTVSANVDVSGVDVKRLQANTVSGELVAAGRSGESALNTVSGDIRAQLQTRRLDVRTVSGQITAGAGAEGDIGAQTVSGRVGVSAGSVQRLAVETVSGDIDVAATVLAPGGRISVQSVSAPVTIRVPANVSAKLNVETFTGEITSAVGQVQQPRHGPGYSLEATLGGGDGDISVESHSGDVQVRVGR